MLLGQAGSAASPAPPKITIEDVVRFVDPEPRIQWLDATRLVVESATRDTSHREIRILAVPSGRIKFSATGRSFATLPDGSQIAYVQDRPPAVVVWNEFRNARRYPNAFAPNINDLQWLTSTAVLVTRTSSNSTVIERLNLRDGSRQSIASLPPGSTNISVAASRDGTKIAYAFTPQRPVVEPANVRIIGSANDVPAAGELWIATSRDHPANLVAQGPFYFFDLQWLANSEKLGFIENTNFLYRRNHPFVLTYHVFSVDPREDMIAVRSWNPALQVFPSLTGTQLAIDADLAHQPISVAPAAYIMSLRDRKLTLAPGPKLSEPVAWIHGSQLLVSQRDGPITQFFNGNRRITAAYSDKQSAQVSGDGNQVAWVDRDFQGCISVNMTSITGRWARRLLDLRPACHSINAGKTSLFHWHSGDGLDLTGLVSTPPGMISSVKYPLLVLIHGGPSYPGIGGLFTSGDNVLERQWWTQRGFIVFIADYRANEIYGFEPVARARANVATLIWDFHDIMSGVAAVEARYPVDQNRLAVIGNSYGGYEVDWLITQTSAFRAAVSQEGYVADIYRYTLYNAGVGSDEAQWEFVGKPWDVPDNYEKQSSPRFASRITTPTLFLNGAGRPDGDPFLQGGTSPRWQTEYLYTALKQRGIDTQFVIYMNEAHRITHPENLRDALDRTGTWIFHHLGLRQRK
jgi:dipeptidyl aminopeptidase/acylaminoacyl peptidase